METITALLIIDREGRFRPVQINEYSFFTLLKNTFTIGWIKYAIWRPSSAVRPYMRFVQCPHIKNKLCRHAISHVLLLSFLYPPLLSLFCSLCVFDGRIWLTREARTHRTLHICGSIYMGMYRYDIYRHVVHTYARVKAAHVLVLHGWHAERTSFPLRFSHGSAVKGRQRFMKLHIFALILKP
jgi:hypothetical protein